MDPIDRAVAVDAVQRIKRLATLPDNDAVVRMSAVEYVLLHLPSVQPDNFLEFLWNVINPNKMQEYLEMYRSREEKTNG